MNYKRLVRAFAREGIDLSREGLTYTANGVEILLPDDLPLEMKAVQQLVTLARTTHPEGGRVTRACATPDFHPGQGIAIGSVAETEGMVIPSSPGKDIGCGMRLHVADLDLDTFLASKDKLIDRLRGDYLLGTRDVIMSAGAMYQMFQYGVPTWVQTVRERPLGMMRRADLVQIEAEVKQIAYGGSVWGSPSAAPEALVPMEGDVRDNSLGTIGRGNHFVEFQVVEEVLDRQQAFWWRVKEGQIAILVHSGSRNVGIHVHGQWERKVQDLWPQGLKHPPIFPLSDTTKDFDYYIGAHNAALNYSFVNRVLLAEMARLRMREIYGDVATPLVHDAPHNYIANEGHKWVSRKGASPAPEGYPVLIPGSMGTPSYLMAGKGNDRFLSSASHGAGRATRRQKMRGKQGLHLEGVECITLREERRIEEAPSSYKPIQSVIEAQVEAGIVAPVARMKPLFTFKA